MITPASFLTPVARVAMAAIFISSGLSKITGFSGAVGYVGSAGVPFPELALTGAILVEVLAGFALLLGFQARLAAAALAGFSVLAGVLFHAYWADTDPQAAYVNQIMFWKNIAMAGGLLYVVQYGPGAYALDNLLGRHRSVPHAA